MPRRDIAKEILKVRQLLERERKEILIRIRDIDNVLDKPPAQPPKPRAPGQDE